MVSMLVRNENSLDLFRSREQVGVPLNVMAINEKREIRRYNHRSVGTSDVKAM